MLCDIQVDKVVLTGPMGAGKSAVARELAALLGFDVVDTDEQVERAAGVSISTIFREQGEAAFREREARALEAASSRHRVVIATGGGTLCRDEAWGCLDEDARVVWLDAPPAELLRRIGTSEGRPLLASSQLPEDALRELAAAREPFYRRAHWRIPTEGLSPREVARRVESLLRGAAA